MVFAAVGVVSVFGGVVIESIAEPKEHPSDDPGKMKWRKFGLYVLIIGLGIDIPAGILASLEIARLNSSVASANQRASDANNLAKSAEEDVARERQSTAQLTKESNRLKLEIANTNKEAEDERLARTQLEATLAPRLLDGEQLGALSKRLKDCGWESLDIVYLDNTPDTLGVVLQLEIAASAAGWKTRDGLWPAGPAQGNTMFRFIRAYLRGIAIETRMGEGRDTILAAKSIEAAYKKRMVDAVYLEDLPFRAKGSFLTMFDLMNGAKSPPDDATIQIIIGAKRQE